MGPDGFLNLLKPPGMTSHDMVAFVRRRLGVSRVGHLGTLDPAAAGVLPIAVGRATRLFDYTGSVKAYRADIGLGLTTDTLDAEGRITSAADASAVTASQVREALAAMVGEQEQVPPAYSAAQVGGKRLYELARQGQQVQAAPRRVQFYGLELVDFRPGVRARALVEVECSAGAYIRVLAQDLGRALGCGAYLAFLLRTRAGRFALEEALTVEEGEHDDLGPHLLPTDWPLEHLPRVSLSRPKVRAFVAGTSVVTEESPAWPVRVYEEGGAFLGLGDIPTAGLLRPRLVLATQEELAS